MRVTIHDILQASFTLIETEHGGSTDGVGRLATFHVVFCGFCSL